MKPFICDICPAADLRPFDLSRLDEEKGWSVVSRHVLKQPNVFDLTTITAGDIRQFCDLNLQTASKIPSKK